MQVRPAFLSLILLCNCAFAQFTSPQTNPAPQVLITITDSVAAPPGFWLFGHNVYWGTNSHNYQSICLVSNGLTGNITLNFRGVTYYFAMTALIAQTNAQGQLNLLESTNFSPETSYSAPLPPPTPTNAPNEKALIVQSRPIGSSPWIDTAMLWPFDSSQTNQEFRLRIGPLLAQATPQMKAVVALHETMLMPRTK